MLGQDVRDGRRSSEEKRSGHRAKHPQSTRHSLAHRRRSPPLSLTHTRSIVHDWKILVSPTHSPRSLWQDEGSPKETKLLPPQPAQHSADPPFKYPRPNTKNRRLFVQKDLSVSLKTSSWNNRFSGPAVCGMDRGSFTEQLCRLSVAKFTVATAMRAETAPQAILKVQRILFQLSNFRFDRAAPP